ncbi:hypothetical protein HZA44_04225 [Candidatus Peregrinibacteria bacterium]|nr:hypothetical protein [Candidatus Peregrinibacteria bacterium]
MANPNTVHQGGVDPSDGNRRKTPVDPQGRIEKLRGNLVMEFRLADRLRRIESSNSNRWLLLYKALREEVGTDVLRGSKRDYAFDDLVRTITLAKQHPEKLNLLTNAGGIYEAVRRFLEYEHQTQREANEIRPSTEIDFDAFRLFARAHGPEIEAKMGQGNGLEDFFYDSFYSENIDRPLYRETDPKFEPMKAWYEKKADEVLQKFLHLAKQYEGQEKPPIMPAERAIRSGWVYFKVNGGAAEDTKMGRLYLNIQPARLPEFYEECLPLFYRRNLKVDAKISRTAKLGDVNRYDKMVIYFNEGDEEALMRTIQELYRNNERLFIGGIPRFSVPLPNEGGTAMRGVGFGEQPIQSGVSFGQIRARILSEVYSQARQAGISLDDPRAMQLFKQACLDHGVDPEKAAFGLSIEGNKSFPVIRSLSF